MNKKYMPNVVDFAYEIIQLHEENLRLKEDLEHHKEYKKMLFEQFDRNEKHTNEFIGTILNAAIDPESSINKVRAVILREQIEVDEKED